ncbi:MAG TPA: ribonuclease HI [Nitrososphaerales archaeon]|nr:ribonuclease HI [Nitrososphaerales archaeon]
MIRQRRESKSDQAEAQLRIDFTDPYIVYFDGLCEPKNPGGVATYGVVVKKEGRTIFEDFGLAYAKPWTDEASNNVAEYSALIHALEWLRGNELQASPIIVRGDSRLIINQMKGAFKVKARRILELHQRASRLLSEFKNLHLEWVDRSRNAQADRLSRFAYHKFKKKSLPSWREANSF